MKTVLLILTIATFTTCQRQVEVKNKDKFEDTEEIDDYDDVQNSSPEFLHPISRFPQPPIRNTNDEARPIDLSAVPKQETKKPSERGPKKNVEGDAYILKYSSINNGFEGYLFGYETSNGIRRNEQLTFRDIDDENKVGDIQGGYEFVDPLGRKVVVTYTAGVEGFKPIIHYS